MDGFEERQKNGMETIAAGLLEKFKRQEDSMATNVKNLENYIEKVHEQQIDDNEKLKKIALNATAMGMRPDDY